MLRVRQKLGKYVIERRLAEGPFANVYRALDTIEGVRVAIKVPHPHLVNQDLLDDFREEVRLMARLDHIHILALKDASLIDGHFVIALPLGQRTLGDRLQTRMGLKLDWRFCPWCYGPSFEVRQPDKTLSTSGSRRPRGRPGG